MQTMKNMKQKHKTWIDCYPLVSNTRQSSKHAIFNQQEYKADVQDKNTKVNEGNKLSRSQSWKTG